MVDSACRNKCSVLPGLPGSSDTRMETNMVVIERSVTVNGSFEDSKHLWWRYPTLFRFTHFVGIFSRDIRAKGLEKVAGTMLRAHEQ